MCMCVLNILHKTTFSVIFILLICSFWSLMATGPHPLSQNEKEQCEHSLKLRLLCSMKEMKSIF